MEILSVEFNKIYLDEYILDMHSCMYVCMYQIEGKRKVARDTDVRIESTTSTEKRVVQIKEYIRSELNKERGTREINREIL